MMKLQQQPRTSESSREEQMRITFCCESAEVVDCVTGFLTCRNPQGGTGGKWLAKVRVVVVGNMATKSEL